MPTALLGQGQGSEGWTEDASLGRSQDVMLLEDDQDNGAAQKHDGRKEESQPVSNVESCISHANLSDECTNIDEKVEPIVDTWMLY